MIYGLNCPPFAATSVPQLALMVKTYGFGGTVYVASIIPCVKGAMGLPIVIDINNNTATATELLRTTLCVMLVLTEFNLIGQLICGVGDGAAPYRKMTKQLQFHRGNVAHKYVSINWGLIQLRIVWIMGYGWYMVFQVSLALNHSYPTKRVLAFPSQPLK